MYNGFRYLKEPMSVSESSDFDYWHALHFSPDRGILIMRVNSVNDSSKKGVYSGGLGFAL